MFNSVIPLNINVSKRAAMYGLPDEKVNNKLRIIDSEVVYVEYAFDHYSNVLINNHLVWNWFRNRKIKLTKELIYEFKLGFADRSLGNDFKRSDGRRSEVARGALQRLGIFKPSGHQFFHGDAIFPFFDIDGRLVGAYGRRVTPESRKEHVYYHHWIGGEASFFNIKALKEYSKLIYCKSPLDALTLISHGIPNVISTMGMYSFDSVHLELLEKYHPKEIIIAFDNSDTGNHAAGLIAQALSASDISCFRLPLPRNQDLNGYACSRTDDDMGLKELIECAFPYSQSYEMLAKRS